MNPDDRRHGTNAGYMAGCRATCCTTAHRGHQKAARLRRHRGLPMFHNPEQTTRLLLPWRQLGLTDAAILTAAGLNDTIDLTGRIRWQTFEALARITEDDIDGRAFVRAGLTRCRAYSLMAAGHPQAVLPLPRTGKWREQSRIRVETARAVRDLYRQLEQHNGPSRQTAGRARNAGWPIPAAWDDPDTLAWPSPHRPYVFRFIKEAA